MAEPWPPAPVGVSGRVVLRLLGLKLATIQLDLTIHALHRVVRWVEAAGQVESVPQRKPERKGVTGAGAPLTAWSAGAPRRAGRPTHSGSRAGNGSGPAEGELREILQLLDQTSEMLEAPAR